MTRRDELWIPRVRTRNVFVRADAYAAGLTRRQVDHLLARGTWRHVVGQVMAHSAHVLTAKDLLLAAGLTRPDCLVLGRVAAGFHGAPIATGTTVSIQVDSPGRSVPRGIVGRMVDVDEPGIQRVGGIVRVAPARWSFIDTLATVPWDEARDLFAYLVSYERLHREEIEAHLAAHPRRRGNGQLRELLRRTATGALSAAEELLHNLLLEAGIHGWEANVRLDVPGCRARVDVLLREARLVIEVDGRRAHAHRFEEDRARDAALSAAGWTVMRVTWRRLVHEPQRVIAQIRAHLARRR